MKVLKIVSTMSLFAVLTACGSGSANTTGALINPYAANSVTGVQTSSTTGGYTTPVQGGTKTLIPVLTYPVTLSGTRTLSQTYAVNAGDQIVVNVQGGYIQSYGTCSWIGGSSSSYLSSLTVQLNGQTLGSSPYAVYTATSAGTLSFTIPAITQMCGSGSTTYQVSFGSGVYIGRCTSTAGAAMTCPY